VSETNHHERKRFSSFGFIKTFLPLLTIFFAILLAGGLVRAQAPVEDPTPTTHSGTTILIFADRRMEDREWTALLAALRSNAVEAATESTALRGTFDIVRGDKMKPGLLVNTAIVVYLHGDCNLEPLQRRTAYGVPLGWVVRVDGRIEPYAHVDCTQIGQVLGPQAQGMNRDKRDAVMAGAMARVILHEWIHIATQSKEHADHGIGKAEFGVADMMAGDGGPVARVRSSR
jgi:hypothetical protein